MKKLFSSFLLFVCAPLTTSASPTIEGIPIGYKTYYRNGYIEIKCDARSASICKISVQFKKQTIRKELKLSDYGYVNAWGPIGAYLDDGYNRSDPISFYFSTNCTDEDYALSKRSVGEVKCTIYGRISKNEVRLENVEVTSTSGDDFSISRGLTP